MEKDLEYFARRARQERAAAANSPNPGIAAVHSELAKRYEALIRDASKQPGEAA